MFDDTDEDYDDIEEVAQQNIKASSNNDRQGVEHKGKLQNLQLHVKAGMEGLDFSKINDIVQKASEGSKFYQHKQKCQDRIDAKISQMKTAIAKFTKNQIDEAEIEMNHYGMEIEASRDLSRTIVHIDMDMFYAAVEMRDDPSLRDKPMAVGGTSMLSTSNYAARKFGVRAAMPGFIAKKLCPDLVIVPCNFSKYREVSSQVQGIFEQYDPNFCAMSLDEACLDISDYMHSNAQRYTERDSSLSVPEAIVGEIRKKIQEKTQLTASAGIAPNTRLAKVCSDMRKPDGQYYLPPEKETIQNFVKDLPIRKISGIGNVTEQQLRALGVVSCSDIWTHRGLIRLLFSDTSYKYFMDIALGLGSTDVSPATERDRKSISTETTFTGTSDRNVLVRLCQDLCKELKSDLAKKNLYGKVFTLKVKTTDFQVRTRAQTLLEYTQNESVLVSVGQKLLLNELDASTGPLSLRLLGVRMSNLIDKSRVSSKKQVTLMHMLKKSSTTPVVVESYDDNDTTDEVYILDNDEPDSNSPLKATADHVQQREDCGADDAFQETPECSSMSTLEPLCNEKMSYVCPVCSKSAFQDVDTLNNHLDTCLNSKVIHELVKESHTSTQSQSSPSSSRNHPVLVPKSKSNCKTKRKSSVGPAVGGQKKHKANTSGSTNTLHKYLGLQ